MSRQLLGYSLLAIAMSFAASSLGHAQGFYGPSEYMDHPPPALPPPSSEFTHLPPPPPPPSSPATAWQREGYRRGDLPAPWASPLWGGYNDPPLSRLHGWGDPAFAPWNAYIATQAPYPGSSFPPMPPGRTCVDHECTGP